MIKIIIFWNIHLNKHFQKAFLGILGYSALHKISINSILDLKTNSSCLFSLTHLINLECNISFSSLQILINPNNLRKTFLESEQVKFLLTQSFVNLSSWSKLSSSFSMLEALIRWKIPKMAVKITNNFIAIHKIFN